MSINKPLSKKQRRELAYLEGFGALVGYAVDEARILSHILESWQGPVALEKALSEGRDIEHQADQVVHELYETILKSFSTPILGEDLILLAQHLDDVVDCVEETIFSLHAYNLKESTEGLSEMSKIVLRSCLCLEKVIHAFRRFEVPKEASLLVEEIKNCEKDADEAFVRNTHLLYSSGDHNALHVFALSQLLENMEGCCDACWKAAQTVEQIALKNS